MSNTTSNNNNNNGTTHNNEKLYPLNPLVNPMLTDMYQITMAYSLWQNKRHELPSVFDLYFRKNPFGGEFTIFAGLEEVIRFLSSFKFTEENVQQIKKDVLKDAEEGFLDWLRGLDCSKISVKAIKEGNVVFPRVPLLIIEGPLGVCQLLETTLLTLVNYASLVATNAARHCIAAGETKLVYEFGLRRAQGPDGGVSASRYSYVGGCDGTSNVLSNHLFGIPVFGTHAHSYVTSFSDPKEFTERVMKGEDGKEVDFWKIVVESRSELGFNNTNTSELVAFASFARTFPKGFVALVDTYDSLTSGVPNFLVVSLALHKIGFRGIGIRLDSGDLAYLSRETRKLFKQTADRLKVDYFKNFQIVASNDLNESTIMSLNRQGHEIDVFAIGTNLVTCQAQPALGCVYKLVEVNGVPRIKLSQDAAKVTLPRKKDAYRLYGHAGHALVDLIISASTPQNERPQEGEKVLCLHPFEEQKRVNVVPSRVEPLYSVVWNGTLAAPLPTISESRALCKEALSKMREDYLRTLNPTPYKVSISEDLYTTLHDLMKKSIPIQDLS